MIMTKDFLTGGDHGEHQSRRLGDFEKELCLDMARQALQSGKPIDEHTAAIIEAVGIDEFIVLSSH